MSCVADTTTVALGIGPVVLGVAETLPTSERGKRFRNAQARHAEPGRKSAILGKPDTFDCTSCVAAVIVTARHPAAECRNTWVCPKLCDL